MHKLSTIREEVGRRFSYDRHVYYIDIETVDKESSKKHLDVHNTTW